MLPDSWVERLFEQMTLVYGHKFLRQWEGVDMNLVKMHWAEKLSGFDGKDLSYALQNLPSDWPPTVLQFRDLCRNAPREMQMLPPPEANPEFVRSVMSQLAAVKARLQ